MQRKRDRMLTNDLLREALLNTRLRPSEAPIYLRSDQYMAIGCDLRQLNLLEKTLRAELDISGSSVLFVAEVSATYMPVADSDALIRWASTLEDGKLLAAAMHLTVTHKSSSLLHSGTVPPTRARPSIRQDHACTFQETARFNICH
jgi:tRNA wybutosine-synthesizing protein 4